MTSEVAPPVDDVVVSDAVEARVMVSPERKFRPIRPPADAATDVASDPGTTDGATPVRRVVAIGAIESIDHQHILGWAWHRPTPDASIEVEVLVDDVVVLTAHADLSRPDLAALGAGNGRHGFLVRDLAEHLSPGPHDIRVRRARDRLDIPGSPKPVIGPEAGGRRSRAVRPTSPARLQLPLRPTMPRSLLSEAAARSRCIRTASHPHMDVQVEIPDAVSAVGWLPKVPMRLAR